MEETMVEKVARAILAETRNMGALAHLISGEGSIENRLARAAIEAMRKPTGAMAKAGLKAIQEFESDYGTEVLDYREMACWRAMIDAALPTKV